MIIPIKEANLKLLTTENKKISIALTMYECMNSLLDTIHNMCMYKCSAVQTKIVNTGNGTVGMFIR